MSENIFVKQRKQIIENLDVLIENKEWEESLALKVVQGRIIAYRDSLQEEIDEFNANSDEICDVTNEKMPELGENQVAVFICLYRSFGDNIALWEQTLGIFSGNALGRPIYRSQSEADKFISDKINREPEAYLEAWINKDMILDMPGHRKMTDKFGSELLSLKHGAITKDSVKYFTSGLGNKYSFVNGKLILISQK